MMQTQNGQEGDTLESRQTFKVFADYAREDSRPVSPYLLERHQSAPDHFTLKTERYISREFAVLEEERLWPRVWQIACRGNDIPKPGDFIEYEIANYSIVVARNESGAVHAFRNACRHRGMKVAIGQGSATEFNCPYHAWTYGLDGTLKSIPAAWDFKHVCRAESGLMKCLADEFDGYVYVNMDTEAEPLKDYLGETVVSHLRLTPEDRMWKAVHLGIVVNCNWKVIAEAFLETYHLPRTHPTLASSSGDVQTQYDYFGRHSRLCQPTGVPSLIGGTEASEEEILAAMLGRANAKFGAAIEDEHPSDSKVNARREMAKRIRQNLAQEKGLDVSSVSDSEIVDSILYNIFPNVGTWRNRCGKLTYRFRPYRDDPEKSIYEVMSIVPIKDGEPLPKDTPLHLLAAGERLEDYADRIGVLGYLLDQDVDNCAAVQRGLHNLQEVQLAQQQESNILHLHENIDRQLGMRP